jgi:hypothetical protein
VVLRRHRIGLRCDVETKNTAPCQRLVEKLGIERIIIPEDAGVGSAIGVLEAPAAFELVKSLVCGGSFHGGRRGDGC